MNPVLFTFWEATWSIVMLFFFVMVIWVFIRVFADIFRRHDINGWAKTGWILLIFLVPFIGALIYIIARPEEKEKEAKPKQAAYGYGRASGPMTTTDDIAVAHEMLKQGDLTQAEFDEIKAKALA